MNKQIVEFDLQAKDYAAMELAESGQGGIARFNQLYRDKFAELIVRECAELAIDPQCFPKIHLTLEEAFRAGQEHSMMCIKKHFGVD